MDFPATAILVGMVLIRVPKTMKNGPRKKEFNDTIQAVEVVPTLVPNNMMMLSRKLMIPELTKETVSVETKVLDCITAVNAAPRKKPPMGSWVIFPIHRVNRAVPKFSISLLKL